MEKHRGDGGVFVGHTDERIRKGLQNLARTGKVKHNGMRSRASHVGSIQAGEATVPSGPFGIVMGSPVEGNGGKTRFAGGCELPYDDVIPAPPGFNKMVVHGTRTTGVCRIGLTLETKNDPDGFERLKGVLVTKYGEPWSEEQNPVFNSSQWEVNPSGHNGIGGILPLQIGVDASLSRSVSHLRAGHRTANVRNFRRESDG